MDKITCEDTLITLMAESDGEKISASTSEQAAAHLANCPDCRQEFEQMRNVFSVLRSQTRREQNADLWLNIEEHLGANAKSAAAPWTKQLFVLFGICLVAYKLLEMIPERAPGFSFKLVPIVLVVTLFVLIRENPFKINTEIILEG
jgi:hypothetical protein